ncbi:MAG: hypothetical protein MUF48_23305 [Pirellulaceae bacterium]|jgi:hypothetical protein|nr:hypothetical protein [Pirellulaceae bacterium]
MVGAPSNAAIVPGTFDAFNTRLDAEIRELDVAGSNADAVRIELFHTCGQARNGEPLARQGS